MKHLLWFLIILSVFNAWAAVTDIVGRKIGVVHFDNSEKRLFKFEVDNNVTCYYMQSLLDESPSLSCLAKQKP